MSNGTTPRNSSRNVNVAIKRQQALEYRASGMSYRAIGEAMGINQSNAYRMVKAEVQQIREKTSEQADELRTIELQRMDAMLAGLWSKATSGDGAAVDRVLRIMERRAKLIGLDSPTRNAFTDSEGNEVGGVGLAVLLNRIEEREAIEPPTE